MGVRILQGGESEMGGKHVRMAFDWVLRWAMPGKLKREAPDRTGLCDAFLMCDKYELGHSSDSGGK